VKVDVDSLMDLLTESQLDEENEGTMSTVEIGRRLGRGTEAVRTLLRRAIADGVVECVWCRSVNMAGVAQRMPRYRLVGK